MAIKKRILFGLTAACLASAANAQQLYGSWTHNAASPLSLFVSPFGSDNNSGLKPTTPFLTLDRAVSEADRIQSMQTPATQAGVTINVLPGPAYVRATPLKVPAFGVSIEAYWSQTPGTVTITGPGPGLGGNLIEFDRTLGPLSVAAGRSSAGLPPSILRGLTLTASTGIAVLIDPSLNPASDRNISSIAVEVNQCTISQCLIGVLIGNQGMLRAPYQNVIVNNDIDQCTFGVLASNTWHESDLFRSNRITNSLSFGMRFDGSSAGSGMMHPRILSNVVARARGGEEIELFDCSARIVNNTIGFVTSLSSGGGPATSISIIPDPLGGSGESIVIANNILFSPPFGGPLGIVNPAEITLQGALPYTGLLQIDSNDFDATGLLITPSILVAGGNMGIANPAFAAAPGNLHLTAASPSVVNPGNRSFVVPGAPAEILLNGNSIRANCALDMDLDPRTHMRSGVLVEVLHRGADQFIETGARLRTATVGINPLALADRFGNLPVNTSGVATADLLLDVPVGTYVVLALGAALPMGPELQHLVLSPFGSLAVDATAGHGTTIASGYTTLNPQPISFNLGQIAPAFVEAEMYLQAMVSLPGGPTTFTNRIRLDVDGL